MAIQNFLSGGFYGSIGELTGRRWKNKRVVQAKFKPKNPKTPAQEAQRRLFTRGSALAKIAQQVNWHAPQFENPIRTDWNQRQTVAINALKNGATEWEALPLAPEKFKAQHIIGECKLNGISDEKLASLTIAGTNLLQDKKYACAIFINTGEKKGQIVVGSGTTDAGSAESITIRLPESDGIIGEECYIKLASYDDTEVETVTLSAGIYLNQNTQTPYIFNPQLESVEMNSDYTLYVKVKLGQEPIESYDPFTNIKISLLDKAWTKTTAVTGSKLDTDNWVNIAQQLKVSRTTVSKANAIVTFAIQNVSLYAYEKFAAKLDITFEANNVKSENSLEASEEIRLMSQEFPEYLQEEAPFAVAPTLYATTNINGKYYDDFAVYGQAYADSAKTDAYTILAFNDDWEGDEFDYSEISQVTVQNGKTYSGAELEELIEEQSPTVIIYGAGLGWYMQEGAQIKSFKGTATGTIYCNGKNQIIALKGFRCYKSQEDSLDVILTM